MYGNSIRLETIDDIGGIDSLIGAAFGSEDEVRLVRLLRNRGELLVSLVAVIEDSVVAHVAASPVTLNEHACSFASIVPLAVLPSHQKQGIGSALMNVMLEYLKEQGYKVAVLLGDPNYYTRFGFKPASHFKLDNEYGATNAFMAMELQPYALANLNGLVRYSQAFIDCGAV